MRRIAFFTLATLAGVGAFGQGLLDCIEPDVLRALLLQGQGQQPPVITATVPKEIAALRLPTPFTWIGSAERIIGRMDATTNASRVTAAWRSSLAPEAARAAATAAMTGSGWELRPMPGMGMNVFASLLQAPLTLCRDDLPIDVNASTMDGVTYLLLIIQRGNNNSVCSQRLPSATTITTGLEAFIPRLDAPIDAATGVAARVQSTSYGYSVGTFGMRAEVILKESPINVARHFARQMAAQGWSSDASWSGSVSAGSTWSRKTDAGAVILGTLQVSALDDRRLQASLRITTLK